MRTPRVSSAPLGGGGSANPPPSVASGLTSGALCYVDRVHTYDVPASLEGLEFVQAANDDKNVSDYSLAVEVSAGGTLHLLIDFRVGDGNGVDRPNLTSVMTWVAAQGFSDSGETVGIDEGGAGGVDQFFAVYSREVSAGVHVFDEQADGTGRNMYTVVFDAGDGGPGGGFRAVEFDATWRYRPGDSEASSPVSAWRLETFDDASWSSGAAPFGYDAGDPFPASGTDLSELVPPMRNNYSTAFLRRSFFLSDPSAISVLESNAVYDDGFIVWINGVEVLRINVSGSPGDPVSNDGLASSGHEALGPEPFTLPDPGTYLVTGENVVAVQLFNVTLTSSDLFFDIEIFDPNAPDLSPPLAIQITPTPGVTIRSLSQVEVTFDEAVVGVDAADLLVDGIPADSLSGSGGGPYVFGFAPRAPGTIAVEWAAGHGIVDFADTPNSFAGGNWSYTVDPDAPLGNVVIHEILAANVSGLVDENGDTEDWFELRNEGSTALSLAGWSATDDSDDPGKWVFPNVSIPAHGYLVVFCSGKDRRPLVGNIHTSFNLTANGEYLGIFNAESPRQVISEIAPRYPRQRADYSYGRDGTGELSYFETPTPGAANANAVTFDGFVLDPICTPGRGFFDDPFDVTMTTVDPNANIRYTLDGSDPSPTTGTLYSGPVRISPPAARGLVPIRAIAYRNGFLPSDIVTHSYIFVERVMTQSNSQPGFPSTWAGGQAADYGMDPEVVNDPGHTQLVRDGLTSIPTLSLVTDVDNFFSSSGNYYDPSRSGIAWERPVSAELILPDGTPGFQVNCGHRIQGGSSTGGWKAIKVSQRLLFKGDYGPTRLRYPLFPGSSVTEFDTIVLDAHLNLTWNHPSHGQRVRGDYVRDIFCSDVQRAMGGFSPHDVFVNLYLNGIYWGVYDVHERPDSTFAADYFGGSKDEYDVLKHSSSNVVDGSSSAYNSMLSLARRDLSTNSNYLALANVVEIPDLVDYMIMNLYAGNDDWPRHNWYVSRRNLPGGVWRFHSWDAEHVLKSTTINQIGVNNSGTPAEIYSNLRANAEFRLLFADHVHRHFFNGGVLYVDSQDPEWDPANPERNVPASIYKARIAELDPAIACESARWGDAKQASDPYTRNNEWQTEQNWLENYFEVRSANVLSQFRTANLYPSVGAPVFNHNGGTITPGFLLTMSRPAGTSGTIYFTLDGSDPRVFGSGSISGSATAYSGGVELEDHTHVVARVRSGTSWSAAMEAVFTLVEPSAVLRFSEIMYNPVGGNSYEFVELKNTGSLTVDLFGLALSEGIFTFPLNTTVGPGEYFVLVSDPTAFASRYPGVPIGAVYDGNLANGGETLSLSDSDGNVVVSVTYDEDDEWQLGPDGFGYSLVNPDPAGSDADLASSWAASDVTQGSPGAADFPTSPAAVVIQEVLPNAAAPFEEAIELFNPSPAPVDISNWFLSNERTDAASLKKYEIPAGTILAAGGYAVFYEADFGAAFQLADESGGVYLSAADGAGTLTGYIIGATYGVAEEGRSFGRHPISTGIDFTALESPTFGVDAPATVAEFRSGSGAANDDASFGPLVINELMYHPSGGREEFIEFYNPTGTAVALYDNGQGRGWILNGVLNSLQTGNFEFPSGTTVPANGYLLLVGIDPEVFRTLHSVPAGVPIVGPFAGRLDNGGESVVLMRPASSSDLDVEVDRVAYRDSDPWDDAADGAGPSLERISAALYGNDPVSWEASTRIGGTPGTENTATSGGGNREPQAIFTATPNAGFAPLEVFLDASQSFDLDGTIVAYDWDFDDGTTGVGESVIHLFSDVGDYFVRLTVRDDEGAEDSVETLIRVAPDPGGEQIPGDCNQDGSLDISDGLCLLRGLFLGGGTPQPCGEPGPGGFDGTLEDFNGDGDVNVSDVISKLNYLFLGGPAHVLGEACQPIPGCDPACAS